MKASNLCSCLVVLLTIGLPALPCLAGCPGGKCGANGGGAIGTFKGNSAKLPVVTSVEETRITVANKKTYFVGGDAQITVNGEPAELSSIQAGMRVLVSGKMIQRGRKGVEPLYRATRITARAAAPEDTQTAKN
jgi:hypothetical protein